MQLLISYFPLIDTSRLTPGEQIQLQNGDNKELENLTHWLANGVSGRAEGTLWVHYPFDKPTSIIPVLIYERAQEIAEHLHNWSEGELARRFTLHFNFYDDGYCMFLMPDVKESIKRYKLARLMYFEDASTTTEDYQILFEPLGMLCKTPGVGTQIRDRISNPTHIGFINKADIDPHNLPATNETNIRILGPIHVQHNNEWAKQYCDQMRAKAQEKEQKQWK